MIVCCFAGGTEENCRILLHHGEKEAAGQLGATSHDLTLSIIISFYLQLLLPTYVPALFSHSSSSCLTSLKKRKEDQLAGANSGPTGHGLFGARNPRRQKQPAWPLQLQLRGATVHFQISCSHQSQEAQAVA